MAKDSIKPPKSPFFAPSTPRKLVKISTPGLFVYYNTGSLTYFMINNVVLTSPIGYLWQLLLDTIVAPIIFILIALIIIWAVTISEQEIFGHSHDRIGE